MHSPKLNIRGADAGAGGMSINSGSGGASGLGMGHCTRSSGADSSSMCLEKCSSSAWGAAASKIVIVVAQQFSDVTRRDECATARAAPARRRLSCPLARSAPACPAGRGPC